MIEYTSCLKRNGIHEKTSKNLKKVLKKVLTKDFLCDIIVESPRKGDEMVFEN